MSSHRGGLAPPHPETRVGAIDVLALPRVRPLAAVWPDLRWRNGATYDRIVSGSTEFLSRDPMVATTRSPYGYVAGDPLNGTDPSGLESIQQLQQHVHFVQSKLQQSISASVEDGSWQELANSPDAAIANDAQANLYTHAYNIVGGQVGLERMLSNLQSGNVDIESQTGLGPAIRDIQELNVLDLLPANMLGPEEGGPEGPRGGLGGSEEPGIGGAAGGFGGGGGGRPPEEDPASWSVPCGAQWSVA